jgi:hypothetical protein
MAQLWSQIIAILPAFPEPLLQVGSYDFKLLLDKDSKAITLFELLLVDNLLDPIIINLGANCAESSLELDFVLGRLPVNKKQLSFCW